MQRQVEVLRTEGEPKPLQPNTVERETKANWPSEAVRRFAESWFVSRLTESRPVRLRLVSTAIIIICPWPLFLLELA